MATRLLKCSLCGEVVDAPVNGSSKPACPTCGGEMISPSKARATAAAASASVSSRPMPARRPLAAPRPVTPGEALSSSASWLPDPDSRSRPAPALTPPPSLPYPPPSAAGKDWVRSPITYVVAGLVVVALGIVIAFMLKGGSSTPAPSETTTVSHGKQPALVLPTPDNSTAAVPQGQQAVEPAPARAAPTGSATPLGTPIDLLAMVDPKAHAIEGGWFRQPDGGLSCDGTSRYNHLVLPYQPPAEYDVSASFTINGTVGDDAVLLIFTDRHNMCTWIVNSWKQGAAGFNMIDHETGPKNPTFAPNHPIKQGERHTLMVKVRKNYIEGWQDGQMLSHYNTTASDLTMNPGWHLDGNQIGLGAMCPTTFHSVELVEVNAHGRPGLKRK